MKDLDNDSVHLTHKVWVMDNTYLWSEGFLTLYCSLLKIRTPSNTHMDF